MCIDTAVAAKIMLRDVGVKLVQLKFVSTLNNFQRFQGDGRDDGATPTAH